MVTVSLVTTTVTVNVSRAKGVGRENLVRKKIMVRLRKNTVSVIPARAAVLHSYSLLCFTVFSVTTTEARANLTPNVAH